MKWLLPILLVSAALPGVYGDRIIFVDGMELEGTVLRELETELKVRVTFGTILLRKERVKKIELNVENRLSEIDASDTSSFLDLAKLCEKYGDDKGLMDALAGAAENEDFPPDRVLQLANLYEKKQMRRELKIALARYLELNPGRVDVAEKLEKLENEDAKTRAEEERKRAAELKAKEKAEGIAKEKAEAEAQKKAAEAAELAKKEEEKTTEAPAESPKETAKEGENTTADLVLKAIKNQESKIIFNQVKEVPVPESKEGLEANQKWSPQNWGNPCEFEIVDQGGDEQNLISRVTFTKTDKEKAAIRIDYPIDLSNYKALTFDIYNGGERSVRVAIAVTTLPGWVFFESYATTVRSKKWATKRTIELLKDKFKSQESNWEYKTEIKNKENTGQLFILIYHNSPQGHIFLDNIKFIPADEAEGEEG